MFSKDLLLKLLKDADEYRDFINKSACMITCRRLMSAHQLSTQSKGILPSLVKKAKEAHEAELVETPKK
jgi:hypothetical protein